jgi:hypothetical protein
MTYPARVQEILNSLYAQNTTLAKGTDDDRRAFTMLVAQQVCYELGPQWGTKKASETRPLSKDTLAFNGPDQLHGWDLINGTTREPNTFPEEINPNEMREQVFVPVPPVNHLKSGTQAQPETPGTSGETTAGMSAVDFANALAPVIDKVLAVLQSDLHNNVQLLYDQNERIFANLTAQNQELKALLQAKSATFAPLTPPPNDPNTGQDRGPRIDPATVAHVAEIAAAIIRSIRK